MDDILLISISKSKINELKQMLNTNFDMKDLGPIKKILRMTIERDRDKFSLKVHQNDYLLKAVRNLACTIASQ